MAIPSNARSSPLPKGWDTEDAHPTPHLPAAASALTSGTTDLVGACEDCVSEIRFHQTALVRALERKGNLTSRLTRFLADVERDKAAQAVHNDTPGDGTGGSTVPRMSVYCFGQCQILQDEHPVEGWTQSRSKSLFKYLVLQRHHPVAKEVLMQVFWPGMDGDSARNNLNVAIYGLRKILGRTLPGGSHVLLEEGRYRLNPTLDWWVDVEQFVERVRSGRERETAGAIESALTLYREAEHLYRDDLLIEDRTEEWSAPERQRLREMALDTLRRLCRLHEKRGDLAAGVAACRRLLDLDPCDEDVHRHLMGLYERLDQPHLALRQFQTCADALARELHMIPSPGTTALYRQIQRRERT